MLVRIADTFKHDVGPDLRVVQGVGYAYGHMYVVFSRKGSTSLQVEDVDQFLLEHTKVIDYD